MEGSFLLSAFLAGIDGIKQPGHLVIIDCLIS